MSSHLKTAWQAIAADLEHANRGASYYTNRVQVLERIRQELRALDNDFSTDEIGALELPSAVAELPLPQASMFETEPARRQGAGLPPTNGAFWKGLLSSTPCSNVELLAYAASALKLTPTPEQSRRLKQRLTNALNAMIMAGIVQSSGTRRERRYFLVVSQE